MTNLNGIGLIGSLPKVRGRYIPNRRLSDISWLRVGGPAEVLFQPCDFSDLSEFLEKVSSDIQISVLGVCSNVIIRDGGIPGVVVRLGKGFSSIRITNDVIDVGAAVLDSRLAIEASRVGLDLSFLRTIPGTIGGAIKMNAGCYGQYISDLVVSAKIVLRNGRKIKVDSKDLNFGYRRCKLPDQSIIVGVTLKAPKVEPEIIKSKMEEFLAKRKKTQPVGEKTCGSTFRNPSGFSSNGRAGEDHSKKAWKLIDDAGLKGFAIGGAKVSELHSNFLVNTGAASSEDFELLGKLIQKRVAETSNLKLEWEIERLGIKAYHKKS